jgi:uncharacterized membrane protein YgaE (UPF0421/DUF939 family)
LAWLIGSALWIALTLVGWLVRGRQAQASNFPELPDNSTRTELTKPVVLFCLLRAFAVAVAFGFHLPNADWMPIATLVAMKTTLGQATLAAEQRIVGTLIGALVAVAFLLTVDSVHALEAVIVIAAAFAASFRAVNYAFYCAAVATVVLIAVDIPNPSNLATEGRRVLFTFLGPGIGILVLLLAGLLQKAKGSSAQPATAS